MPPSLLTLLIKLIISLQTIAHPPLSKRSLPPSRPLSLLIGHATGSWTVRFFLWFTMRRITYFLLSVAVLLHGFLAALVPFLSHGSSHLLSHMELDCAVFFCDLRWAGLLTFCSLLLACSCCLPSMAVFLYLFPASLTAFLTSYLQRTVKPWRLWFFFLWYTMNKMLFFYRSLLFSHSRPFS